MINPLSLGASLYVPADRPDIVEIGNGVRYPALRSVIFCLEDAILPEQLPVALEHLRVALPHFRAAPTRRFVRVRSPEVLAQVLALGAGAHLDGFVLPKITRPLFEQYLCLLEPWPQLSVMPVLETVEVFDAGAVADLRALFAEVRPRVAAVRIGGNDLMNLLGVRRNPLRTVYETPLGPVIASLAAAFLPYEIPLTAPVFEGLAYPDVLAAEVERDLEHGLYGKTAVHPEQVTVIEALYAVSEADAEMAQRILEPGCPAVFSMHGTMCEPATHERWARTTLARADFFGTTAGCAVLPRSAGDGASRPVDTV